VKSDHDITVLIGNSQAIFPAGMAGFRFCIRCFYVETERRPEGGSMDGIPETSVRISSNGTGAGWIEQL
jgi:hypothetical protein